MSSRRIRTVALQAAAQPTTTSFATRSECRITEAAAVIPPLEESSLSRPTSIVLPTSADGHVTPEYRIGPAAPRSGPAAASATVSDAAGTRLLEGAGSSAVKEADEDGAYGGQHSALRRLGRPGSSAGWSTQRPLQPPPPPPLSSPLSATAAPVQPPLQAAGHRIAGPRIRNFVDGSLQLQQQQPDASVDSGNRQQHHHQQQQSHSYAHHRQQHPPQQQPHHHHHQPRNHRHHRHHAALVHARHCLARALSSAEDPDLLVDLLASGLGLGLGLGESTSVTSRGTSGATATTTTTSRAGGGLLSSSSSWSPPMLLDPVCMSAALCRMARLEGVATGAGEGGGPLAGLFSPPGPLARGEPGAASGLTAHGGRRHLPTKHGNDGEEEGRQGVLPGAWRAGADEGLAGLLGRQPHSHLQAPGVAGQGGTHAPAPGTAHGAAFDPAGSHVGRAAATAAAGGAVDGQDTGAGGGQDTGAVDGVTVAVAPTALGRTPHPSANPSPSPALAPAGSSESATPLHRAVAAGLPELQTLHQLRLKELQEAAASFDAAAAAGHAKESPRVRSAPASPSLPRAQSPQAARQARVGRFLRLVDAALWRCWGAATAGRGATVEGRGAIAAAMSGGSGGGASGRGGGIGGSRPAPEAPTPAFTFITATPADPVFAPQSLQQAHLRLAAYASDAGSVIDSPTCRTARPGQQSLAAYLAAAAEVTQVGGRGAGAGGAGAAATAVVAAASAPVQPFRPREVANVMWGLACLRWSDAQLCGNPATQAALLRQVQALLPPPLATDEQSVSGRTPGGSGVGLRSGTGGAQAGASCGVGSDAARQTLSGPVGAAGMQREGPAGGAPGHSAAEAGRPIVSGGGGGDSRQVPDQGRQSGGTVEGDTANTLTLPFTSTSSRHIAGAGGGGGEGGGGSPWLAPPAHSISHSSLLRWKPGELSMLAWAMARAGVSPPSRTWLLSYLAAWDEQALTSAAPSELACLAWALAEWQRKADGVRDWAKGRTKGSYGERVSELGSGAPLASSVRNYRRHRRGSSRTRPGTRLPGVPEWVPVRGVVPAEWLASFWAATQESLNRTAAAAAAASAAMDAQGSADARPSSGVTHRGGGSRKPHQRAAAGMGLGLADSQMRHRSLTAHHYRLGKHQDQHQDRSRAGRGGSGGVTSHTLSNPSDRTAPHGHTSTPDSGAGGSSSSGAGGSAGVPPRPPSRLPGPWGPSELAMLLWSLGVLRLSPLEPWLEAALRAAAATGPGAPPLALATTLLGAARLGRQAPLAPATPGPAGVPVPTTASTGEEGVAGGLPAGPTSGEAAAGQVSVGGSSGEEGSGQGTEEAASDQGVVTSSRPHVTRAARPVRPSQAPMATPAAAAGSCQSLLAAFSRPYLRRCAASLERFSPSHVVDLMEGLQVLSASGHLPAPAAMPLPLGSLLDAAAARLQRGYGAGLGLRHLTRAAACLAALGHEPRSEWLLWWLDEMHASLTAKTATIGQKSVSGAGGGAGLRSHELVAVLRALTAFKVVPGPIWTAAFLDAAARRLPYMGRTAMTELLESLAGSGMQLSGSGAGTGRATTPGHWPWLTSFLCLWSGRGGRRHLARTGPLPVSADHATRLCTALAALAGPVASWPAAPRAALEAALRRCSLMARLRRTGRRHGRGGAMGRGQPRSSPDPPAVRPAGEGLAGGSAESAAAATKDGVGKDGGRTIGRGKNRSRRGDSAGEGSGTGNRGEASRALSVGSRQRGTEPSGSPGRGRGGVDRRRLAAVWEAAERLGLMRPVGSPAGAGGSTVR